MNGLGSNGDHEQSQSQEVKVGGDFQVGGEGNVVDFSQTHVDLSQAQISQTQILQVAFDEIKTRPLIPRSPYLGLRKFEGRDRDLFFGRDRLIAQLQTRLKSHFVVVLGASGSGKSSLIRAGLIPQLAQQRDGSWRELILTPDRDPYESFRASLMSAGYRQSATDGLMSAQPDRLLQTVKAIKEPDGEWLIFVDQFEEIFTLCTDAQTRQTFIDGLINIWQSAIANVDVVIAMRADFLDRFSAYPALAGVLQYSELVTDLGDDELRLAIEQPAAHHGVVFEPGLVKEIIQDLKGRSEVGETERVSLPLLQYTLKLLWERSGDLSERILRTRTYRQLGGVRGALQRRVDEIYQGLPESERETAKHIFLHLVDTTGNEPGTTAVGKAVSRRAVLSDFQTPAEQKVLQQLIDANLLISDRPNPQGSAIVELAHETLIDSWDTLKGWIEDSKPLIRLHNQLQEDAHRWHQLCQRQDSQADAELWQGTKLQRILINQPEIEARFGALKTTEKAFVEAGQHLAEEAQRRKLRRLRQTITGVSLTLLAVSGLAVLATWQWIRAEHGQLKALSQTSQAEYILNRDTMAPLLSALEAGTRLQQFPSFFRSPTLQAEVMTALAQGVYWNREYNRLAGHISDIEDVAISPNGQSLASVGHDETLRLWDAQGTPLHTIALDGAGLALTFNRDGQTVATATLNGDIQVWTIAGEPLATFSGHDDFIHSLRSNPAFDLLISASEDGTVKLWTFDGNLKRKISTREAAVRDVAISPDGTALATARADGTIELLDFYGQPKAPLLTGHEDMVTSVQFSEDGQWLISGSRDGKLHLWTADGKPIREWSVTDNSIVFEVAFSPDSQYIMAGLGNGITAVWDLQGQPIARLAGHSDSVKGVSFGAIENDINPQPTLVTASADRTIKFWQLDYAPRLRVLDVQETVGINSVGLSRDGQRLAASTSDGRVALWQLDGSQAPPWQWLTGGEYGVSVSVSAADNQIAVADTDGTIYRWTSAGIPLPPIAQAHEQGAYAVSFDPRGQVLASGGQDQLVKLWDVATGNLRQSLSGHTAPVNWISIHPEGHQLASTSDDGTAKLWDISSGQLIATLQDHKGPVWGVTYSHDGQLIATASSDQTVKLWTPQGELVETLIGHDDSVNEVQFSNDDQFIFSSSHDKTIKVWRRDGGLLGSLAGHTDSVYDISMGPDSTLISGSPDGRVIIWNLHRFTLSGLVEQGCDRLQDYLRSQAIDWCQ